MLRVQIVIVTESRLSGSLLNGMKLSVSTAHCSVAVNVGGCAKFACCRFRKHGSVRTAGRHWTAVKAYVKKLSVY